MLFKIYTEEEKEDAKRILQENMEKLQNKIVPEFYPGFVYSYESFDMDMFEKGLYREAFISMAGFSLVSMDWIKILSKLLYGCRTMEIMAGCGIITKALSDCGCDIFATDNFSWGEWKTWTEIECIDCMEAVEKYGKNLDYLLVSWPEMNDTIYKVLLEMRKINPDLKMIYIGEFGGACADSNFTSEARILNHPIIDEANTKFKSWAGLHDRVFLIR